ncbi:MAG: hypothetical protein KDA28_01540, partial [Phycisphaerales bacterium]|nr:hypothetical protein [Phycisphaerales bacterium]
TGVFLAVSDDGLEFVDANEGRPIFVPPRWTQFDPVQDLTRDPSIVFIDGVYHMVWTSNWSGEVMGYAHSTDLRHWSEPLAIRPFPEGTALTNVWAPEIDHDPVHDEFIILFSTTLREELEDGDGSEDQHGGDHRLFTIRTRDFESFTEASVLFDPDISTIDADLHYDDRDTAPPDDDRWIMVYKREVGVHRGGKNMRIATRDREWATPWVFVEDPIIGPGTSIRPDEVAEGPTLIRSIVATGPRWLLYWDCYGNGHYSVAGSDDLETWTDLTDRMVPPRAHPRHGSPFVAPIDTVAVPLEAWPPAPSRPRPMSTDDARPTWTRRTWAGRADFDAAPKGGVEGGPCLRVTSGEGADAGWSHHIAVRPHTDYRLRGWIRTRDVEASTGMGAVLNVLGRREVCTPPVTGTSAWTPVEVEFTTGRETAIEVLCLFGGWGSSKGEAWFDGVRLEER